MTSAMAAMLTCTAVAPAAPRIVVHDISAGAPMPCGTGNIDLETQLADNPRDPNNIVQDFMRGPAPGPGITILTASSQDGGQSWKARTVPDIACTGAPANTSADPWVSFGPDGEAYLALGLDYAGESEGAPFEPTGESLAHSTDDGRTWSSPVAVQPRQGTDFFDKASVTADPYKKGRAYYIFSRRPLPAGTDGVVLLSRTTDGGAKWSAPRLIYSAPQAKSVWGNTIFVMRDGTLVDVFNQNSNAFGIGAVLNEPSAGDVFEREGYVNEMMAMRSTDGGTNWSKPVQIGVASNDWPQDPKSGEIARLYAYGALESAVAPDGTIYAVWSDNRPNGVSRVLFSRSRDEGRTWSPPRPIHVDPLRQVFGTAVAVAPDGTVGAIYYDDRNVQPNGTQWPIDVWFADSADGGATWQETHLGGPFDLHRAALTTFIPYPKFRELGDFVGMTGLPGGFGASFTMVTPPNQPGPSDVYFARIWTRGCLAASGRLAGNHVGPVALGTLRSRLRHTLSTYTTRNRKSMDFYCLTGGGVRAGYPSAKLLRALHGTERSLIKGRAVLALTANRRYAVRGVHPHTALAAAMRRLHLSRGYKVGLNTWYIAQLPIANGILKVRHGLVEEVGLCTKSLTRTPAQIRVFLTSFN
jgi:BNR repeat-like domain